MAGRTTGRRDGVESAPARRIGEVLAEKRLESGLSQSEAAEAAGEAIGRRRLERIEAGRRRATTAELIELASAYGTSLGDFLPSRRGLDIDVYRGRVEIATDDAVVVGAFSDPAEIPATYVEVVRVLRGLDSPGAFVLRDEDVDVIARLVGTPRKRLVRELEAAMEAVDEAVSQRVVRVERTEPAPTSTAALERFDPQRPQPRILEAAAVKELDLLRELDESAPSGVFGRLARLGQRSHGDAEVIERRRRELLDELGEETWADLMIAVSLGQAVLPDDPRQPTRPPVTGAQPAEVVEEPAPEVVFVPVFSEAAPTAPTASRSWKEFAGDRRAGMEVPSAPDASDGTESADAVAETDAGGEEFAELYDLMVDDAG